MFNNLGLIFRIYLTIINNQMQKSKQLEKNKVLFKAIEEEKTYIKAKFKAFANFTTRKLNSKSQRRTASKKMKEFVEQPKCKKCNCKHLAD